MANFVIVTTQRSGSTWFIDMLNSHPNIMALEGVFMPKAPAGSHTRQGEKGFPKWNTYRQAARQNHRLRSSQLFSYLDEIYNSGEQDATSRGFKVMYNELSRFPEIFYYLISNKIFVIHLYRENLFEVVLSHAILRETGKAHFTEQPGRVRVRLDPSVLTLRLYKRQLQGRVVDAILKSLPVPTLSLSYEDLCDQRGFAQALDFLGESADGMQLRSDLVKINTWGHRETLVNYPEIKSKLQRTPFAHMIE